MTVIYFTQKRYVFQIKLILHPRYKSHLSQEIIHSVRKDQKTVIIADFISQKQRVRLQIKNTKYCFLLNARSNFRSFKGGRMDFIYSCLEISLKEL